MIKQSDKFERGVFTKMHQGEKNTWQNKIFMIMIAFFENFKNLRNNKINFNDCIETPILLAMIPEVDGKRVLDIGCGMGQHAKQYSDMGAESVLGIDISEKMLEYAKEHFHAKNITYRQMALEDICQIDEQFDLITSSLAFDYAEDLDKLMEKYIWSIKIWCPFCI